MQRVVGRKSILRRHRYLVAISFALVDRDGIAVDHGSITINYR